MSSAVLTHWAATLNSIMKLFSIASLWKLMLVHTLAEMFNKNNLPHTVFTCIHTTDYLETLQYWKCWNKYYKR